MTQLATEPPIKASGIVGRKASPLRDLLTVAGRAVRAVPREPEAFGPALIIPLFFFLVNTGALQKFTERSHAVSDYKAFQLPVAIIFAVTGVSRAPALVTDIQGGYFDRLMLTPVRRLSLLLGLMMADLVLLVALVVPVTTLGFALGVRFETGVAGLLVYVVLACAWGTAFNAFSYAVALKTGNPAAVNSMFLLFFPFAFLTTAYLPRSQLTGWLATVADWNPVTYLLAALRSLLLEGWEGAALLKGLAAIAGVAIVSFPLALAALRGRVARGA